MRRSPEGDRKALWEAIAYWIFNTKVDFVCNRMQGLSGRPCTLVTASRGLSGRPLDPFGFPIVDFV